MQFLQNSKRRNNISLSRHDVFIWFSTLLYPTAKSHLFFFKYYSRFPKCPLKFSCNSPICTFLNHVPFCYILSTFPFSFPFCFLDFNTLSNLILSANMRIISVRTSSVSLVKIMLTLIPADFLLWRESLCYIWVLRMAFLHTAMGEPEPITIYFKSRLFCNRHPTAFLRFIYHISIW